MKFYRIGLLMLSSSAFAGELEFNRDIRPILSENCFQCHGPDSHKREAELRLDTREGALEMDSIVPGAPDHSEIMVRITSNDPDEIMPPRGSHLALTKEQIATLEQWIKEGAEYQGHWGFEAPVSVSQESLHEVIDLAIQDRLKDEGLTPSEMAGPETLIRRLSLDLRGLPPKPEEIDAFLTDKSPDAWESLVDRMLASPQTAERLALDWLDAARYSDTNGYSIDDHRDMWGWRDWVIHAFMENKPYDEFLTEQLAGDLIPDATPQQVMATGFLRNSMNTHEGGIIPEEYRVAYLADKVDTVSSTFMGLTMKCAQCHDHKYDPISQKDYYRFYAFFDSATEHGLGAKNGNTGPAIEVESPLHEVAGVEESLKQRVGRLEQLRAEAQKVDTPLNKHFVKEIGIELEILENQLKNSNTTSVMVMDSPGTRVTRILNRGEYDKPGEEVTAGVPEIFPQLPGDGPVNRLALAEWFLDEQHPLTARVAVNRYWQLIFGTGLVRTPEDFGSQGEWPSHPELLDALAVRFRESGWDVRALLKEIVMSDTYRQCSDIPEKGLDIDPQNRLLARGARVRLQAELVRDNALSISGLLNPQLGGPSVYPEQPDGLWRQISHFGYGSFTAQAYYPDEGSKTQRRSMYTFWKRTAPPPSLAIFDAPTRETCTVRRMATNTPLQALVLLNDPQYLKAARALAKRMSAEGGESTEKRIAYAFRLATARLPNSTESGILLSMHEREKKRFTQHPNKAADLLLSDDASPDLAALTVVASTILNLNETLTRQ